MMNESTWKTLLSRHLSQLLLIAALAGLMLYLSAASPFFWQWENLRNIADQSALMMILGVGMTLVIIAGGIDLSVGAIAALSGIIMALLLKSGTNSTAALTAGLVVGVLAGLSTGGLISRMRLNPFIVTLAMMSVIRGVALILSQGMPVYNFPAEVTWLGKGFAAGLPVPLWLALAVVLAGVLVLNTTRFGQYVQAIGGNEEALHRSGVQVRLYKTAIYALSGFCAALAGIIVAARLNTAEPTAGWMFELEAIAAVILGGTSMKGGVGSVAGTVIACLLLGVLRNGLTILSIHSYYQQLLIGLIILFAVVSSEIREGIS